MLPTALPDPEPAFVSTFMEPSPSPAAARHIAQIERYGASNYAPLPVVLTRGEGSYVWDVDGVRYVDMLSAYSALNQGHCHPRLVRAMQQQAERLALTSRAFHNDRLGDMLEAIAAVSGMEAVLPMNSGAEAVETAIKAMRRHAYRHLGVAENHAQIVVARGNFHGRTTAIVSFSSDPASHEDFGPYMPGFVTVPYGDVAAVERVFRDSPNVVGVLVEPIQGEAGVIVPPADYLPGLRRLCDEHERVLCLDEIQTGLGRTGAMFAFEHAGIRPDLVVLGKALSGGMYPVSALAGPRRIMDVFTPGSHGSTFGGSPLAAVLAVEALAILRDEGLPQRAAELGAHMLNRLRAEVRSSKVKEIRGQGLLLAVEFHDPLAKEAVLALKARRVLAKDTHGTTVRFAPPLTIPRDTLDDAITCIVGAVDVV